MTQSISVLNATAPASIRAISGDTKQAAGNDDGVSNNADRNVHDLVDHDSDMQRRARVLFKRKGEPQFLVSLKYLQRLLCRRHGMHVTTIKTVSGRSQSPHATVTTYCVYSSMRMSTTTRVEAVG